MRDPIFPVFCVLGIILCLLPLPWHWKARSTGTLIYIGWVCLGCINMLVNSLVWAGNTDDVSPVWCNISINIMQGLGVSIMASTLCIHRRLYCIATLKYVSHTPKAKRRDVIIELLLGVGFPLFFMALCYATRPNQYNIMEDFGCWPSYYNSLLNIPVNSMWPIILSITSCIYGGLAVRAFLKTRRQFSRVLSDSESGLNMSRYFRLMGPASTGIAFLLPFSVYFLISNLSQLHIAPWISWDYVHTSFSDVDRYPFERIEALHPIARMGFDLNRWLTPAGGFLFFLFFGFSSEATEEYRRIFWLVATPLKIKRPAAKPPTSRWSSRIAAALTPTIPAIVSTDCSSNVQMNQSDRAEPNVIEQDITEVKIGDLEAQA